MAEYLDEAGLTEVWNNAKSAFASSDHTHTGYASTSHTHSNATTSSAGFLRQLNGSTTQFLNGAGNWATPSSSSSGGLTTLYSNSSGSTGTVTLSSTALNKWVIFKFKSSKSKGDAYASMMYYFSANGKYSISAENVTTEGLNSAFGFSEVSSTVQITGKTFQMNYGASGSIPSVTYVGTIS